MTIWGIILTRRCFGQPGDRGDCTSDDSIPRDLTRGVHELSELVELDQVTDVETILMLPPPSSFNRVLKKMAKVKWRLGYSFKGMEQQVEDLFWEVERR